jgi:hypothetical protein
MNDFLRPRPEPLNYSMTRRLGDADHDGRARQLPTADRLELSLNFNRLDIRESRTQDLHLAAEPGSRSEGLNVLDS